MKHYLSVLISSILAGLCITIGATCYLYCLSRGTDGMKVLGSFLFALGLYTIIHFSMHLYTGKVGYILDNKPKYFLDLLVVLIGNFIGVIALSALIRVTRLGPTIIDPAKALVDTKQNDSWYSILILSFMCGIMIYLAVEGHKKCSYPLGKALFCFLSISVFILCGYEHCIANAVYYTYAGYFSWKALLYFIIMIIGNGIGSVTFDGLIKLVEIVKKDKKNEEESK